MRKRRKDGTVGHYVYHRLTNTRIHAPLGSPAFEAEYLAVEAQRVASPDERPVYVYFIQGVATRHIKIGKARRPAQRLRELQVGCPDELVLLGCILDRTGGLLEGVLHQRFATQRLRGEWFRECPELLRVATEGFTLAT